MKKLSLRVKNAKKKKVKNASKHKLVYLEEKITRLVFLYGE